MKRPILPFMVTQKIRKPLTKRNIFHGRNATSLASSTQLSRSLAGISQYLLTVRSGLNKLEGYKELKVFLW